MIVAAYMRYSITDHKADLEQWPGPALRPIIYRDTFEEASRVAKEWCALYAEALGIEPDWVHHPEGHSEPDDPYNWVGSWGWKVELRPSMGIHGFWDTVTSADEPHGISSAPKAKKEESA